MNKTVRVRIAVGVDPTGDWNAYGGRNLKEKEAMEFAVEVLSGGESRYWLTADLEIPQSPDVSADVEKQP